VTTFSLDSSALVAWILQEVPRWRAIDALLSAPTADPVLPAPGLTEVIETDRRRGNGSPSTLIANAVAAKGVRTELLAQSDLIRAADLIEKSKQHPGAPHPTTGRPVTLSLGDARILAEVERLGIPLVTLDTYWADFSVSGHTADHVLCV
jgi:PIN domain nuclease of toxin-antitoxin system